MSMHVKIHVMLGETFLLSGAKYIQYRKWKYYTISLKSNLQMFFYFVKYVKPILEVLAVKILASYESKLTQK